MEFVNLCPHAIRVMGSEGVVTFAPSGAVARVSETPEALPLMAGFRLVRNSYGPVTGLPEAREGVCYIVSGKVLAALAGTRSDCVGPDTGPTQVRLASGQTDYVTGFVA